MVLEPLVICMLKSEPHILYKSMSEWIIDLNRKPTSIKALEEGIRENICDSELETFHTYNTKAQFIK